MSEKNRNFGPCLSPGCLAPTGHKSQFCEKCRTANCPRCGEKYASNTGKPSGHDKCAKCRKLRSC